MASKDRKGKAQTKAKTKVKKKAKSKIKSKVKAKTKVSKRIENWMSLMQEMDTWMLRSVEDIYDTLINNGMPLESFPTFVQEAYKAKKEARRRKPF